MTARAIRRRQLVWRPVQFDFAAIDGERGHLGLMVAELTSGRFSALVLETSAAGVCPIVVGNRKTRAEAQRLCRDFAREWKRLPIAREGSDSLALLVAAARVDQTQEGDPLN